MPKLPSFGFSSQSDKKPVPRENKKGYENSSSKKVSAPQRTPENKTSPGRLEEQRKQQPTVTQLQDGRGPRESSSSRSRLESQGTVGDFRNTKEPQDATRSSTSGETLTDTPTNVKRVSHLKSIHTEPGPKSSTTSAAPVDDGPKRIAFEPKQASSQNYDALKAYIDELHQKAASQQMRIEGDVIYRDDLLQEFQKRLTEVKATMERAKEAEVEQSIAKIKLETDIEITKLKQEHSSVMLQRVNNHEARMKSLTKNFTADIDKLVGTQSQMQAILTELSKDKQSLQTSLNNERNSHLLQYQKLVKDHQKTKDQLDMEIEDHKTTQKRLTQALATAGQYLQTLEDLSSRCKNYEERFTETEDKLKAAKQERQADKDKADKVLDQTRAGHEIEVKKIREYYAHEMYAAHGKGHYAGRKEVQQEAEQGLQAKDVELEKLKRLHKLELEKQRNERSELVAKHAREFDSVVEEANKQLKDQKTVYQAKVDETHGQIASQQAYIQRLEKKLQLIAQEIGEDIQNMPSPGTASKHVSQADADEVHSDKVPIALVQKAEAGKKS